MDAETLLQASRSVWLDRNVYLRAALSLSRPEAPSSVCGNSCQPKETCAKSVPSVARPTAQACSANSPYAELVGEINAMRNKIEQSLKGQELVAGSSLKDRVAHLEEENRKLQECFNTLKKCFENLQNEFTRVVRSGPTDEAKAIPPAPKETKSDDDVDLFGSEEESEDEEKERIRKERLMAYEAKKSKKPVAAAKSSVILEVKPWDDETDMKEMESRVRSIEMDGLVWGACNRYRFAFQKSIRLISAKLVPVGYGIKKLQIMCVVEDEKVSMEVLSEQIEAFEDFVQSVDIAAFNKI
ncbi:EF-1 guanine nucleotide exchange domain protein [Trichuris suis]|nr:EF-1 guanine nucleotide exchange domain protein [Trichuris suis]